MKKPNLKSIIAAAVIAVSTVTAAQAGPFDGVYDCNVSSPLPNPNTTFDIYLVFMSRPNGEAGFAGLTIPHSSVFSGSFIGQLNGNTFTMPNNNTNLTFSAPQSGPMTISGKWSVLSIPVTSFTCTQVF